MKKARVPLGSKRAVVAGVDLFFPGKTKAARRKMAKKALGRMKTGSPEEVSAVAGRKGCEGCVTGVGLLERKTILLTERALGSKPAVSHELPHFFKAGKFDWITANAVTGYLAFFSSGAKRHFIRRGRPGGFISRETIADVGWAIKHRRRLKFFYGEHDKEADIGGRGHSVSRTGIDLGLFSAAMERSWGKPASGLFLIREICNGVPVENAVKKIESGAFDAEIKAFAKRHLANLLAAQKPKYSRRHPANPFPA